ncbi:MAG: hypothetical protein HYU57_03975 [Micavibrio aeruginosavorus]|nr:hypothetical protein [Micavibrio aeruginosavorus]
MASDEMLDLAFDVSGFAYGLAVVEGFQNCEGFGFTPAPKRKHLFTKGDIVKADPPVDSAAKNDVASPNKEA